MARSILHSRDRFEREDLLSAAEWAIAEDLVGYTCATPTYPLGTSEVTLLQASPMPGGGWAFHLVIDGKGRPLVEQVETSDGGAFTSWTNLIPTAGGTQGRVTGQPGVTWGEVYVSVPASVEDRIEMQVVDTHHEEAGNFTLILDEVVCEP